MPAAASPSLAFIERALLVALGLFAALVIYDISLVLAGASCELYLHPVSRALRKITGVPLAAAGIAALAHLVQCVRGRRWRRMLLDLGAVAVVAGLIYATLSITLFHCMFYGVDLGRIFGGPR
jgi:hypothetical protein